MATTSIVLKKPSLPTLMSPGIVSIMDASGFDTVTARYISQITANEVTKNFAPGSTKAGTGCPVEGGKMILMGATDTADLPGNCCEYTVTWRGLLSALPGRDEQITETRSVRERLFDKITGVPNAPADSRARLLELQAGLSVRSIHLTKPPAPALTGASQSPLQGLQNPGRGYSVINAAKTYCYPNGWICYSWQSEQPIPGIWFVTAEYKYEQDSTSG
jgi:hypothetical protein